MNIKVCGLTDIKQIRQLDGLSVDFAGLIFVPESPRYAGEKLNSDDLLDADFDIRKTGVFKDADYAAITKAIKDFGLDVVQLHGNESPDLCEKLSARAEVIKAFAVDASSDIDEMIDGYDAVCDYYLFDTKTEAGESGGTGQSFNWDIIATAKIEKPFFLSGGIGPADAKKIKAFDHPDFYGIDINSRFETVPGVKDMKLILKFLQDLK